MKSCFKCSGFGYMNDNGQGVCGTGKNFDYRSNTYHNIADTCRLYKAQEGPCKARGMVFGVGQGANPIPAQDTATRALIQGRLIEYRLRFCYRSNRRHNPLGYRPGNDRVEGQGEW